MRHIKLVVLGDSVTATHQLQGQPGEASFIRLLQRRLGDAAGVEVIPSALDGVDSGYAVRRFDRMVGAYQPDMVLVMLGLNDVRPSGHRRPSSPEEYRENLMQLADRIMALDAKPVLATPTPRLDRNSQASPAVDVIGPYVAAVRQAAESHNLSWIDVHSRFSREPDLTSLIPDGVHPDARGHWILAETFSEALLQLCGDTAVRYAGGPCDADAGLCHV